MDRKDLIDCILNGFNEMTLESANEDKYGTPEYIENFSAVKELPIDGDVAQYAWEFGIMMAREGFKLDSNDYDEYLQSVLEDSDSGIEVSELY